MRYILLFLVFACLQAKDAIKVHSDVWMPFNGKDTTNPGYALELISCAFEEEVIFEATPWEQSLADVKEGKADVAVGASKKEAKELICSQESIGNGSVRLYALKGTKVVFKGQESLKGIKIGVIADYSYWPELDELIANKGNNLVWLTGEDPLQDGINKLLSGEIDVLPENAIVFDWKLKAIGFKQETIVLYESPAEPIFMVFTNNEEGQELADRFDTSLRRIRATGELDKMLAKYHLTDWKKEVK